MGHCQLGRFLGIFLMISSNIIISLHNHKKNTKNIATAFDDTPSNVNDQDVRPPSQNQDVQTDYTDKYPPLDTIHAFKQSRTNEKTRTTRLANKSNDLQIILRHIQAKQSSALLKHMRTDHAAQLRMFRDAQKPYCRRTESTNDSDMFWQEEINQSAKLIVTYIETYLLSTSRPPSAASHSSKAESAHNFFDANLPRDEILFNRRAPSGRDSSISISSTEFSKALEEGKQHG